MVIDAFRFSLFLASVVVCFGLGIVTGGIYEQGNQPFSQNAENIFCEYQQLGVSWIRMQSDWPNTSPSTYQSIVKIAHSKGIAVNVIVPALYCGDDSQPPQIDQFISNYISHLNDLVNNVFVRDATVDSLEIGNELNIWETGCSDGVGRFRVGPNAFAWLIRRVMEWKYANNRPEKIVSGGLLNTYTNEQFWPSMFSSGAWNRSFTPFNYFGIHPYNPYTIDQSCIDAGRTDCFGGWQSQIKQGLSSILNSLVQLTGNNNVQFFVTEFGVQRAINGNCAPNTNCVLNANQQAAGMTAAVEAISGPSVFQALWYDYRDDTQQNFGIRSYWTGSNWPAVQPTWQNFKNLAGGQGSNNPEQCWS